MKSADVHFIGIGADELQQSSAHSEGAGIGIGKTKNIFGQGIRFEEDFTDARTQYLGFSGSRTGNHHHRPLEGIYGQFLLFIK